MNMQQFTGWVTRLLNALPWRRAHRAPKPQARARVTSPSQTNRFMFSDDVVRRQKAETNPLCSTLPEEPSASPAPPTAAPPPLLPAPATLETPLALPPPAKGAAEAGAPAAEASDGSVQADSESRLAFARYLYRRGVFNEGFTRDSLPAQYRDGSPQE